MGKSAYRYLKKLLELSNYHEKQVELIAVDSAGHYYTEHGRMGLLRGMTYLESAPERVSYVSNSLTVDDSRMVFLEQLSTPITLQSETGEITLRYFGISQSMTQLNDYFRCDAYENNNSVYGCADAGDGRLGSHPPHPQRRESAGQDHPHPCHDRQRLP